MTLTACSAAFPVMAGGVYQFTGQVTGALAASLGQGGRIVAMHDNGETLLWQNPANFNGTTTVQRTFTGNASGAPLVAVAGLQT
ncbi:MAG: hypothetical protein IPM39_13800 [Chloroflexi bacterium]|nr:hypothetical protein [Chloroflexota bacterium]